MTPKFGTFEGPLSDRYRFEAELGRGGMGTVYRAMDLRLGRPVAIKMLHPALTNDLGVARFQEEIRIAARLRHARIVAVHDSGEAAGHLYYVMDFVAGETLRAKIKREKQLSVDDALAITGEIAEGLQYAHDHDVVHRDVKPENVILCNGHACVVDFGLARALDSVDTDRLTASGLAVGTPHYLSPEQAAAEKDVGPKADQYALACVLYEMLAGEPPFTGPTASSIAMKHIGTPPVPIRKVRRSVPQHVEAALLCAMEKVPADRLRSIAEFVVALQAGARRWIQKVALACVAAAILGAVGVALALSETPAGNTIGENFRKFTGRDLDTNKVVVFPIRKTGKSDVDPALDEGMRSAFAWWSDIHVASSAEMNSATTTSGNDTGHTLTEDRTVARSLRAGSFVTAEVVATGTGQILRVELHDARGARPPRRASLPLLIGQQPESSLAKVAYEVLFQADEAERNADVSQGTKNRAAFAAYLRGKAAERTWNLVLAQSEYDRALTNDPRFTAAALALAEIKTWGSDSDVELASLLTRVVAERAHLPRAARIKVDALNALAGERYDIACSQFHQLVLLDSLQFSGWFGIGECNRRDSLVVRSSLSPSRHAFRGSAHTASMALVHGFKLLPSIDACCVGRVSEVLRRTLITSTTQVRRGRGVPPDTSRYAAYPELSADTIAFVPFPMRDLMRSPPPTHTLAVDQQRRIFSEIAMRRVRLAPTSADALEELAEAMELRGDAATADTLRSARRSATNMMQTQRLAATEALLRIKYAIPDDLAALGKARVLADSLIRASSQASGNAAVMLAGLAAVLGDANRAALHAARGAHAIPSFGLSAEVMSLADAYLAFASTGGDKDSLVQKEDLLSSAIENDVVQERQGPARDMLVGRAVVLAYPHYQSAALLLMDSSDYVVAAERAHARKHWRATRSILVAAMPSKTTIRAADLTLDMVYLEAWLLASAGDTVGALKRLGPPLDAIKWMSIKSLQDVANAGALPQAMALRSELLKATGDHRQAMRWSRAAVALAGKRKN